MKFFDYILSPIVYLFVFIFLSITTLHLEIDFLKSIHLELLVVAMVIISSIHSFLFKTKDNHSFDQNWWAIVLICSLFITSPILTSLINSDYLQLLSNGEYKGYVKVFIVIPFLFYFFSRRKQNEAIIDFFLFSYFVYGLYFLFRFFYMGEARSFDLRPTLSIRHGDPNFIATYFSMIVPLVLYQIKTYLKPQLRYSYKRYLYIFLLFFFSGCVFVTESRMGLLALSSGLFFSFILIKWGFSRKAKGLIYLSAFLVLSIYMAFGQIVERFQNMGDESNIQRIQTLENGVKVFFKNPIVGIGWHKSTKDFFYNTHYPPFQSEIPLQEIHNTMLLVLAELGVVGFFIFILFFYYLIFKIWKSSQINYELSAFSIISIFVYFMNSLVIGAPYKDLVFINLFVLLSLNTLSSSEVKDK